MATQTYTTSRAGLESYKRFIETSVCDCGEYFSRHVETTEQLRKGDAPNCALTKDQCVLWHTPLEFRG